MPISSKLIAVALYTYVHKKVSEQRLEQEKSLKKDLNLNSDSSSIHEGEE